MFASEKDRYVVKALQTAVMNKLIKDATMDISKGALVIKAPTKTFIVKPSIRKMRGTGLKRLAMEYIPRLLKLFDGRKGKFIIKVDVFDTALNVVVLSASGSSKKEVFRGGVNASRGKKGPEIWISAVDGFFDPGLMRAVNKVFADMLKAGVFSS